jgi:nitric oxide reductase subunit B
MKNKFELLFITLGLLSLLGGLFFGVVASMQFVFPDFLQSIPFYKTRPLHVSLVVAWIFLASIGGIYYYIPSQFGIKLYSKTMSLLHFVIFLITGIVIIIAYLMGKFGGRGILGIPSNFSHSYYNFLVIIWMELF